MVFASIVPSSLEADLKFWQVLDLWNHPRLGAVGQITIGKVNDRQHMRNCNAECLDRHLETVAGRGWSDNSNRALTVSAEHRLKQVGLFGLGWQTG